MTDRSAFPDFSAVEAALGDLATAVEWPQTPDILAAVAPRLATSRQPRQWMPIGLVRPSVTRSVLIAAALVLLLAGIAIGIRYGLDLLEIQFGPVPTAAPATPSAGSTLGLGSRTGLDELADQAAFPVVVPGDPGNPDVVYLGGSNLRGQVAFVYAARDGLPASDLLDGAGLLITQNQGSLDAGLARKVVDSGGTADPVLVGQTNGYWFAGNPHGFWYMSPEGRVIAESGRRVGNTLAWQRDGILYRIEGEIGLERALEIAESMP